MTLKDVYMSGIFNDDTQIELTIDTKAVCYLKEGKWYEDEIQKLFMQYKNAMIDKLDYCRKKNLLEVEVTA